MKSDDMTVLEVDLDENAGVLLVEYGVTDSEAVNWNPVGYEEEFVRTPVWRVWAPDDQK